MHYQSRELLVTTKMAEAWNDAFERRVDELMGLVGRIDNDQQLACCTEVLDVYEHEAGSVQSAAAPAPAATPPTGARPFRFVAFKN